MINIKNKLIFTTSLIAKQKVHEKCGKFFNNLILQLLRSLCLIAYVLVNII
jgi:hypothetical protein